MILVMGGTSDGRELATALQNLGHPVQLTVSSTYGEKANAGFGLRVHTGALNEAALVRLIADEGIRLLVDATHPYAALASETAMSAAKSAGIPCLRYERPASRAEDTFITVFDTPEALAEAVGREPGRVLLTIGSNHLKGFSGLDNQANLYVRMLPSPELIGKVLAMGFRADRLLAMQGPFSQAFNEALIRQWGITLLVTKDSAGPGGFEEKLEAARSTGIRLFLLGRPPVPYARSFGNPEELIACVRQLLES